jgi:hypothetical protein
VDAGLGEQFPGNTFGVNMVNKMYKDESGAKVFVSPGIATDGRTWITVRQKPGTGKGTRRVKSPALPIRQSLANAQADLDTYAKRKGWAPIGGIH